MGAAVLIFLILKIPRSFEQEFACRQKYVRLYVEIENMNTVDSLLQYFDVSDISVPEFQINKDASKGSVMDITIRLGIPKGRDISKTLSEMAKIDGVTSVEEIEQ
ncbi:hypothetical protein SDC9_185236 [bioreactor metagenome]|uniref:ACT domain-containing protein n=1 Tax=bioreactor metagenome TaxID=1076179 RepID=A0A645HGM3_9ZZZZ